MEVLSILLMILSVFLFVRKFQMFDIYLFDYDYHETVTNERIKKFQLICDAFCVSYYLIITLVCGYYSYVCISNVFDIKPDTYNTINIVLISLLFFLITTFLIIKSFLYKKFGVNDFYNNMVEYRSKQKVVTKDNDDEVSFLRSYKDLNKIEIYSYVWLLIGVILFIIL